MSDDIIDRVHRVSQRLARVEVRSDDAQEAADLREAMVLALEILCEDEPEWFALCSLIAHMEDSARWVIERHAMLAKSRKA